MFLRAAIVGLISASIFSYPARATDDQEGSVVADKTKEFSATELDAQKKLAEIDFFSKLSSLGLSAKVSKPGDINSDVKIVNLGKGDHTKVYDIVIQPGHYGRKSGKTGAEGKQVTEQKLVAYIAANVASYLADQKTNFIVIPADGFEKPLKTRIFLAIHADGSDRGCSAGRNQDGSPKLGASLGYKEGSDLLGMHTIGFALAASMGQDYDNFRKDNFTIDEHHYYAFNSIDASGYSGLLEVGEISCVAVENELIQRAALISKNLGVALRASLDILKEPLDKN